MKKPWIGYVFAAVAVLFALIVRQSLVALVGELPHYIVFYPTVMLIALFFGLRAGLLATFLSALAADYYFLLPVGFGIGKIADAVGLAIFLCIGVFLSVVSELYLRLRQREAAQRERLIAADEIERQRRLLEITLVSIGDGVIVADVLGRVTFLNGEAERLTGWKNAEAVGRSLSDVFYIVKEETSEPMENPVEKVLRQGTVVGLANHTLLVARDGRKTPIDDSGAPIQSENGKPQGVILVFRDVSERRKAEAALREREERFKTFMDNSPAIAWAKDEAGRFAYVNKTLLNWLDVRPEDWIGKTDAELTPEFAEEYRRNDLIVLETNLPRQIVEEIPCPKGKKRLWWVFKFPFCDAASNRYVGGIGIDITEQRKAEEDLKKSECRFQAFMDNTPAIAWAKDEMGHYVYINQTLEKQFGARLEDWQGKGDKDVWPMENIDLFYQNDQIVLRTDEPHENMEELPNPDGTRSLWWIFKFPYRDASGKRYVGGIGIDITEQRKAENELRDAKVSAERAKEVAEKAQEVAENANRVKDLFLATLSHELRTPLTPVLLGVARLQRRIEMDPDLKNTLEMVRRNVEMEARLIDDLLDLTRIAKGKVELQKQRVELREVLHRAVEVCQPDFELRGLHFSMNLGTAPPYWIDADVGRLQQVFWNLLKNAVKFTPHGGNVSLRCRLDGATKIITEIKDDGIGIESDTFPGLFNAFSQSEQAKGSKFGGLGLGLAISKGLVQMHGGSIEAESEGKGKGATFRVVLPLATAAAQPEITRVNGAATRIVGPLRILLVEDHGVSAKMMQLILEDEGYTVETAGDVAAALDIAQRDSFDLLISDLGLPDGSGHDLMRRLRQQGKKLPGIALSGYGQREDIQRSYEAGFTVHITKPASPERLLESILSMVGHASPLQLDGKK